MRRLPVLLIIAVAFSCGKNPAQPAAHSLLILGTAMSALGQGLDISRDGTPVTGADVRVNGTIIPEIAPGFYRGDLPAILDVGAQVTLVVRAGGDVVTGVTKVPTLPALVTPVDGDGLHPGTPLAFSWTDASSPDEFELWITYVVDNAGFSQRTTTTGDVRSGSVATTSIPATATTLQATVIGYGNGTFTGPADPASRMHLRQDSNRVTLVLR